MDFYGTIGPACADVKLLQQMVEAGMTGIRMNLSHGPLAAHKDWLALLRKAGVKKLLIDLQGPELRIGRLPQPLSLTAGQTVRLGVQGIPCPTALVQGVQPGQELLLDDGKLLARVDTAEPEALVCTVVRGGVLQSRKSLAAPGADIQMPTLTTEDKENLAIAADCGVTGVMLPFVRGAADIRNLRQALAEYLAEYRGVQCDPEQLVVGAGLEYLLGLLAPLLPGPAAVETPGYPRALQVLENTGMRCCCLPVDEGGLSLDALDRSGAAVCYVTPSHQFPTGVTMPAGRRAELLHWAARAPGRRYIIEDDYDSEFRFDTRPLPSLQGMAGADGPVVYLSTCSRSLAPGIRIAYMVLPRQLLGAWQAKYRLYSGTVGRFEQQTLARFITGGYFTRHLARERTAYKARRDALVAALRTSFAPEELTLAGLHTGLHLLAQLKDPPPDAALRAAARQYGVRCSLLSDYDLTGTAHSAAGTLVLGYGSLPDADCAAAGERLKKLCTAAREASDTV